MSPYYGDSYGRGPGVPFGINVSWTRTVKWLIGINLGVLVFQVILSRSAAASAAFWDLFAMHPRLLLAFPPRIWQVVTYMFLHRDGWHLFFNMLGLFFFAGDVERELGTKRFLRFYFACGIAGALLYCLFQAKVPMIGASAGVLGVLVAFAIFYPNAIIYVWMLILVPIRAKYLAMGFAIVNLLQGASGSESGIAYWAHVGGMGYAFLYLWVWPRYGWQVRGPAWRAPRWLSPSGWARRWQEERRRRQAERHAGVQEELDRILAKVHNEGLHSLTKGERQFLKKVSTRYRDSQ